VVCKEAVSKVNIRRELAKRGSFLLRSNSAGTALCVTIDFVTGWCPHQPEFTTGMSTNRKLTVAKHLNNEYLLPVGVPTNRNLTFKQHLNNEY
jgi:hypothetical protein